jgi:hypothetical protein
MNYDAAKFDYTDAEHFSIDGQRGKALYLRTSSTNGDVIFKPDNDGKLLEFSPHYFVSHALDASGFHLDSELEQMRAAKIKAAKIAKSSDTRGAVVAACVVAGVVAVAASFGTFAIIASLVGMSVAAGIASKVFRGGSLHNRVDNIETQMQHHLFTTAARTCEEQLQPAKYIEQSESNPAIIPQPQQRGRGI